MPGLKRCWFTVSPFASVTLQEAIRLTQKTMVVRRYTLINTLIALGLKSSSISKNKISSLELAVLNASMNTVIAL